MYKDRKQLTVSQTRRVNGRWASTAMTRRLDLLTEALTERKPVTVAVEGLSQVWTEYTGMLKARAKLLEDNYAGVGVPPNFVIEVGDGEGAKINSSIWQGWYKDPGMREAHSKTPFRITITSTKLLHERSAFVVEDDGSLRPLRETPKVVEIPGVGTDYVAHPGFAEQYTDEEEYASIKRQIIRHITRKDREPLYAAMRAEAERFEPFHARLAAEGLDYKETLEEYEAANTKQVVVMAEEPKVTGAMTLQELKRLITGYGEVPATGEEQADSDWMRFEARFVEINGEEARKPLLAALKIMQRERDAALATSD